METRPAPGSVCRSFESIGERRLGGYTVQCFPSATAYARRCDSLVTVLCRPFSKTAFSRESVACKECAQSLRRLFRMCPVLIGRGWDPVDLGVIVGQNSLIGGRVARQGRRPGTTILCNSLLPADLRRVWLQKKEAPLPARIFTIDACQTRHDSVGSILHLSIGIDLILPK